MSNMVRMAAPVLTALLIAVPGHIVFGETPPVAANVPPSAASPPAAADTSVRDAADQAAIRAALNAWTGDFNARGADKVCDLFEPGLIYDFQGLPEQTYQDLCARLRRALGDSARSWTYAPPDIKEILVFGDMAVVRLIWTSTVSGGPEGDVKSIEPGMDIFRRQADGSWKIMRYTAFSQ